MVLRSKLLQKRGAVAPVVVPSIDEETRSLLFPTDAEEEAAIAQGIEEDERGESIPGEQAEADLDRAIASWKAEALQKVSR